MSANDKIYSSSNSKRILMNICVFPTFSDVTVLLSLTVFSLMVTEMLPKVSDANPILG